MNTVELAIRIKALRRARKMTLADLARATGLTESMMSKIENFRVTPSLPAVAAVAAALGTTLADLFRGLDAHPQITVVRAEERRKLQRDDSPWTYYALTSERADRKVDPFLLEIPPGRQREQSDAHEGDEFMFLLEGRLDFQYGGKTYPLSPGDSVYHDGSVKHNLVNAADGTARILVLFCQPGFGEA